MTDLDPKIAIPEFQAKIRAAQNCSDMLEACRQFVTFHGGFSNAPDVRQRFNSMAFKVEDKDAA